MNSELINAIDEAIDYVNEDITAPQQVTLLSLINKVEGTERYSSLNTFKQNPWGRLDNKWDKLVKEIPNTQLPNSTSNTILKVNGVEGQDGVAIPDSESYIAFDANTQSATLTTKDKATPVDSGWLKNKLLGKTVYKWLKNNPRNTSRGLKFEGASISSEKDKFPKFKKNQRLDYTALAEFYFNLFNDNKWNNVPSYWQTAIANDIINTKSILSSISMHFIDKAESIEFRNKPLLTTLEDEQISQLIHFIVVEQQALDLSNFNDNTLKQSFILSAILTGCFNSLSYRDGAKLIEEFTNIKRYYGSMKDAIKNIIEGDDEEDKAEALAENAILNRGSLDNNPFIRWARLNNKAEYLEEYDPVKLIDFDTLMAYSAVTQDELKRILTVIMDPDKGAELNWYLLVNSKKYPLKENNKNLSLANSKQVIEFFEDSEIKIVFSREKSVFDSSNKLDVDLEHIKLKNTLNKELEAANYFDLTDDGLTIKTGQGFKSNKFTAKVEGSGRNEIVVELNITYNEELKGKDPHPEKPKPKDEQNSTNSKVTTTKETSKITKEQAKDAIKRYLLDHPTKLLKGKEAIDQFIDHYKDLKGNDLDPKYITRIVRSISDLMQNPEDYDYDAKLNKINSTAQTTFSILLDLLNGDLDSAIEQQEKENEDNKSRIPGVSVKGRSKSLTAQQVADKLKHLEDILRTDKTNSDNRVAKHTMEQINSSELSDLIKWFNSRFNPKNQANVSGQEPVQPEPKNNVMGTRRKPMGRK